MSGASSASHSSRQFLSITGQHREADTETYLRPTGSSTGAAQASRRQSCRARRTGGRAQAPWLNRSCPGMYSLAGFIAGSDPGRRGAAGRWPENSPSVRCRWTSMCEQRCSIGVTARPPTRCTRHRQTDGWFSAFDWSWPPKLTPARRGSTRLTPLSYRWFRGLWHMGPLSSFGPGCHHCIHQLHDLQLQLAPLLPTSILPSARPTWGVRASHTHKRNLDFFEQPQTMRGPDHTAVYRQWPGKRKLKATMAAPPR